jgi:hypothetical protein
MVMMANAALDFLYRGLARTCVSGPFLTYNGRHTRAAIDSWNDHGPSFLVMVANAIALL